MMGRHPPYRKRVKIGISICLLASGLIVGTTFLPWFTGSGGHEFSIRDIPMNSASGWDLYGLRAPGEDGFAIDVSLADPGDGGNESIPTGFSVLISGLCLAFSTIFPLARFKPKGTFMQQARRRALGFRLLWVAYLVSAGLLGLFPPLSLVVAYLQQHSTLGVSVGYGLILLCAATLAGTVGVLMSGSGITQAESLVPDVRKAVWRHPYRLSGACPTRTSVSMLAAAAGGGVFVGFVGYWGGRLVFWLVSQLPSRFVLGGFRGVGWLQRETGMGNGQALAWVVIVVMIAVTLIAVLALGYPILLGRVTGGLVADVAAKEKCRNMSAATMFGLVGGAVTWGTLAFTGYLATGAVHESSHVLMVYDSVRDTLTPAVVAIDAALIVLAGVFAVRQSMKQFPFCEASQQWYGMTREATVPVGTAVPLLNALGSGSADGLSAVQAADPAELAVRLQRCQCGLADAVLTVDVRWQEVRRRKAGASAREKTARWFQTTLPAELGMAIENALFPASSEGNTAPVSDNAPVPEGPDCDPHRQANDAVASAATGSMSGS